MTKAERIAVLKVLLVIAERTCRRCRESYEYPISVIVDECNKELKRLEKP